MYFWSDLLVETGMYSFVLNVEQTRERHGRNLPPDEPVPECLPEHQSQRQKIYFLFIQHLTFTELRTIRNILIVRLVYGVSGKRVVLRYVPTAQKILIRLIYRHQQYGKQSTMHRLESSYISRQEQIPAKYPYVVSIRIKNKRKELL